MIAYLWVLRILAFAAILITVSSVAVSYRRGKSKAFNLYSAALPKSLTVLSAIQPHRFEWHGSREAESLSICMIEFEGARLEQLELLGAAPDLVEDQTYKALISQMLEHETSSDVDLVLAVALKRLQGQAQPLTRPMIVGDVLRSLGVQAADVEAAISGQPDCAVPQQWVAQTSTSEPGNVRVFIPLLRAASGEVQVVGSPDLTDCTVEVRVLPDVATALSQLAVRLKDALLTSNFTNERSLLALYAGALEVSAAERAT